MKRTVFILLALCAVSINVHAAQMGTPIVPLEKLIGTFDTSYHGTAVMKAAFPLLALWEIVSSPAFINLALVAVAFIARKNAKTERWGRIVELGLGAIKTIREAGSTDWRVILGAAMQYVSEHVTERPDIKSLSVDEVVKLQAVLAPMAKAAAGIIEKPMVGG